METFLLPLTALLDPASAIPKGVVARKWLISLMLLALATIASGVAVAERLDAARLVIPKLQQAGELGKSSEREIDEQVQQTQRVALVAGVAKGVFVVPLQILLLAVVLKALAWLLARKALFIECFTAASLSSLPLTVFHLILAASAWRQPSLTVSMLQGLVPSSLAFFLPDASPGLARVYGAIDLVNLWAAALLGLGFGTATKLSRPVGVALGLFLYVLFAAAFLVGAPGLAGGMGGKP